MPKDLRCGVPCSGVHFAAAVACRKCVQWEVITAKALKQHTGDFIKRLRAGEPFVLTYRGKRIGIVTPCTDGNSCRWWCTA